MMSIGKGAILSFERPEINSGSSTKAKLIGIADALGIILWKKYYMEAQGYTIDTNILFQDNKSTILLATNGRQSAGKKSKHIKNKYFLVADKVDQGDLKITHEGTDTMWADYHSKPLQGSKFCTMRSKIMNSPIEYDDDVDRRFTHPLLLPKYESDKGVVSLEKNTMEKAVVNCGVEIRNATLRKGSDILMYQRAGKQLEK